MNGPVSRELDQFEEAELARLGVKRVAVQTFHWGGFRYSNARDAIAAAKRGEKP